MLALFGIKIELVLTKLLLKMLKNEKSEGLGNSLSLQSLSLPGVASEFGCFSKTACAATVVANVVGTSTAASTHDVHGFSRAFTH